MEEQSGILCLEAYSDQDWEEYGDNIACEQFDSPEYRKWVSEHWDEELIRRRRNYTKPLYAGGGEYHLDMLSLVAV